MDSQRVIHHWATNTFTFKDYHITPLYLQGVFLCSLVRSPLDGDYKPFTFLVIFLLLVFRTS